MALNKVIARDAMVLEETDTRHQLTVVPPVFGWQEMLEKHRPKPILVLLVFPGFVA